MSSQLFGGMLMGIAQGYVDQKEKTRQEALDKEKQDIATLSKLVGSEDPDTAAFAQQRLMEMLAQGTSGKQKAMLQAMTQGMMPQAQPQGQPTLPPTRVGGPQSQAPMAGPPPMPVDLNALTGPITAPPAPPPTLGERLNEMVQQFTPATRSEAARRIAEARTRGIIMPRLVQQAMEQEFSNAGSTGNDLVVLGTGLFDRKERKWVVEPKSGDTTPYGTSPLGLRMAAKERELKRPLTSAEVDQMIKDTPTDQNTLDERYVAILSKPEAERTTDDKAFIGAYERNKKLVGEAAFARSNPLADQETVRFTADQLLQPGGEKYWNELTGGNETLQRQVRAELAQRGMPLQQLTTSNRQLGETATTIIPKIRSTIRKLDDPKLAAKLGPISGRWQEFMAGKVGAGDPDFAALRATVSLINTGTMRAHVSARGGQMMLAYFTNLMDAKRMDAATLKASLGAIADFLQGYADQLKRPSVEGPPPAPAGAFPPGWSGSK